MSSVSRLLTLAIALGAAFTPSCRCQNKATCANGAVANTADDCVDATGPSGTTGADGTSGAMMGSGPVVVIYNCVCAPQPGDADGDCEPDAIEDTNGNGSYDDGVDFSNLSVNDTDGDGVLDGCEDTNHNGVVDPAPAEGSPTKADSDGDGLPDGIEDSNHNGFFDPTLEETNAANPDTDADGFKDGDEDRNHDGKWNCPEDLSAPPCETNPRKFDTDGDGLSDKVELQGASGAVFHLLSGSADSNCNGPGRFLGANGVTGPVAVSGTAFDDQTCPWAVDSDGDGIRDGLEDKNADGVVNPGESDPRNTDTDGDGLSDGYEDADHNGLFDPMTETDPTRIDTDDDGLSDGTEDSGGCLASMCPAVGPAMPGPGCDCSNRHANGRQPNESDPKLKDTDGDGLDDGVEDQNGDGVCQLAALRAPPLAVDETCTYMTDSDGDILLDGIEDKNGDGRIDLGETDARRADPDRDCLLDNNEVGTDPFVADTDGDGLPDGLERLHLNPKNNCAQVDCSAVGLTTYLSDSCTDPTLKDSDGDGFTDGVESFLGVQVGEDKNLDGCIASTGERNPCAFDAPQPPAVGSTGVKCLDSDGMCPPAGVTGPNMACVGASGNCATAREDAQALLCSEGNIKPLSFIRSVDNDYTLALPARKTMTGIVEQFEAQEVSFGGGALGQVFQSVDAVSNVSPEPVRSVFGGILRLANIGLGTGGACDVVRDSPPLIDNPPPGGMFPALPMGTCAPDQHYLIANGTPLPSDVAEAAFTRLNIDLAAAGFDVDRTAGPNFLGHDDQSSSGLPSAIKVQVSQDRYVLRRTNAAAVDVAALKRTVLSALIGRNTVLNDLPAPATYASGPVADMRILFYRREVRARQFGMNGVTTLVPIAQYGVVFAIAPELTDCAGLSGLVRARCKIDAEPGISAVDDLTNGSALARYSAIVGTGCEPFDPTPAKADFVLVVDDSVSMQDYIKAISRAAGDVALRLRANSANLAWRLALTTSNMGRNDNDSYLSALPDAYNPEPPGYPAGGTNAFAAYQSTAFDSFGAVKRCTFAPDFDPADPLKSPYCCNPGATADDGDYFRACCTMTAGTPVPSGSTYAPTGSGGDNGAIAVTGTSPNYEGNDTLRCYDFPRYNQFDQVLSSSMNPPFMRNYSPTSIERKLHFVDYQCGDRAQREYPRTWGTRGHLWPPGFRGANNNPREDGANLLIRNADMLITQMNRPCAFDSNTAREGQGSGAEHPLQAVKRVVERAVANGRDSTTSCDTDVNNCDSQKLRTDAPLFTILLSDEEDYALKYRNNSQPGPTQDRDMNALPQARCVHNGDDGCTIPYCEGLFPNLVAATSHFDYRVPAAQLYSAPSGSVVNAQKGNYCMSPFPGFGPAADYVTSAASPASTKRYSGYFQVTSGIDENSDVGAAAYEQPNSVSRDVLNQNNGNPATCGDPTGADCLPCTRFLRTRQYIDFFTGQCSPPNGDGQTAPTNLFESDPRRYHRPYLKIGTDGRQVLPLGNVYAITRRAGVQGGAPGSCGSPYPGGDGTAFRDVSLASGGRVADICLATRPVGFTEFLDEVIVDAQGTASPYRLRGNPISTSLRVGVLAKNGNLRILRRSSTSGFDYNPVSRTISFFVAGFTSGDESIIDKAALVTQQSDLKVLVSYRVYDRQCEEECAVRDTCAVCACSNATPWCCTQDPTYECRPEISCPQGCGACETCDVQSNTCRPVDPCGTCGGGQTCNLVSGKCETCVGSVVTVPCTGEGCQEQKVCVTTQGVPNGGATCVATSDPKDCCGAEKTCLSGEVCVLEACSGESCLAKALCKPLTGGQAPSGACAPPCDPVLQVCSPRPCAGEACPPDFVCVSLKRPPACTIVAECTCPNAATECISPDCALGDKCVNERCVPICTNTQSVAECCAQPGIECCPPGQTYNAGTQQCSSSCACTPACADGFFCDQIACACLPRGG